jgi:hypothetical protein
MSLQFGIGSGSIIVDLLDAILQHLDSMEEKLQPLGRHLVGVGGNGDGTLHADDNISEHGASNDGILAVGEGDDALPANGDSDVPSCGGDATTPVIGDVLAAISGGAIGTICGAVAPEGVSDSNVLLMTDGGGDSALSANGDSSAHDTAMCDILGASDSVREHGRRPERHSGQRQMWPFCRRPARYRRPARKLHHSGTDRRRPWQRNHLVQAQALAEATP